MYINEVLRTCDALCPNEYSDKEKYMWCDELSAMLTQEHLKKYDRVTVEADGDGTYLLPEGVTFEMVDRIIDGVREIDKLDFRSYGIEYYYGQRGRFVFPVRHRVNGKIDVIYLKPHTPIRTEEITDYTTVITNNTIRLPSASNFVCGDTVTVETENEEFENVSILGIAQVFIPVVDSGGNFTHSVTADYVKASVPDNTFNKLLNGNSSIQLVCNIKRVITDETVCGAPYDRMYVDFVNAQICYYQRDFDTYNQHMNLFNQRLNAYQAWLQQRRVQDKDGRMVNWI